MENQNNMENQNSPAIQIEIIEHEPVLKKNTGTKCEHGTTRYFCIPCGGKGLCQHQKNKYYCSQCKNPSFVDKTVDKKTKTKAKESKGTKCEHGKFKCGCKICNCCPHGNLKSGCKACNGCEHGRLKRNCADCGGANICPHKIIKYSCIHCWGCAHGKVRSMCAECGGSALCIHEIHRTNCNICAQCEHGKITKNCTICAGCEHGKNKYNCNKCNRCPHNETKYGCDICNLCEHGKNRHKCNTCTGCEHGKQKQACNKCKGCEHGKLKINCATCDGANICEHKKIRSICVACKGSRICEHGKQRHTCALCGGSLICEHGKQRQACLTCNSCPHGKLPPYCKPCGGAALCRAPWCETIGNPRYENYCVYCFTNLFPDKPMTRNYKTKEFAVVEHVKQEFPDLTWIADKRVADGCSGKRPDLLVDMGSHIVIVEVDENKHGNYECSCENKRLMQLSQDLGHRPIVFLRFNPDEYTDVDGVKHKSCWKMNRQTGILSINKALAKEWNTRLSALSEQIRYWLAHPTEKMVEIVELFY